MTPEQKDEAIKFVDRLIRQWVDDEVHSESAMFKLRDEMARLGVPKYFGPAGMAADDQIEPPTVRGEVI